MPVITVCPGCKRKIRIADDLLGRRVKCPSCQTTFQSAAAEPPPEEVEELQEVEEEPEAPRPRRRPADEGVREQPPSQPRRPAAEDDEPPRPRRRYDEDADEDEEDDEDEDRRRRRRRKRRRFAGVADGDWGKVLTGLNCYVASIFVGWGAGLVGIIGLVVIFGVLAGSTHAAGGQVDQGQAVAGLSGLVAVGCAAGLLLLVAGILNIVGMVFCLGAPDAHGAKVLAIVVLVLAVLSILSWCGGVVANGVGSGGLPYQGSSGGAGYSPSGGGNAFSGISGLLDLAEKIVFLFFLRALAQGLREDGLARGVIALLIGWVVGIVLAVLGFCGMFALAAGAVTSALSNRPPAGGLLAGLGVAGLILVILLAAVWLGLYIWYLVVLFMVRGAVANHVQSGG